MECTLQKPFTQEEKESVKKILQESKSIAVVGLSPDESKDSHRVAAYLQRAGYKIIPVYPKKEMILGEKVYRTLGDIPFEVDIVDVFRKSDALASVVDESMVMGRVKLLWAQIGCHDAAAISHAVQNRLTIVSNRCLMVEHRKLFGE